MRRRNFISLIGGGAVAWPLVARAQAVRLRRVGVLMSGVESDTHQQHEVATFRHALQELGWNEQQNLKTYVRWFGGDVVQAQSCAREIVDLSPDVIVVVGNLGIEAAREATQDIPTVFVLVGNPVGNGFVRSQAHPGGKITGFSAFEPAIAGKWTQLLKEIAPNIKRVIVLFYPKFEFLWHGAEAAAAALEIQAMKAMCQTKAEIEQALAGTRDNDALIVLPTPLFTRNRDLIIQLAAIHKLPAIYPYRYYATAGGLMSYGFNTGDVFRRSADYVDRILKGANPGNLPVQAPTKFELTINLKTAKALSLSMPLTLLATADEVIK